VYLGLEALSRLSLSGKSGDEIKSGFGFCSSIVPVDENSDCASISGDSVVVGNVFTFGGIPGILTKLNASLMTLYKLY